MNDPWYSLSWFSPERWRAFQFEDRLVLYGILGFGLLFLVRRLFHQRSRQQLTLSFGAGPRQAGLHSFWQWGRYLLPISFLLGISCVLIALARPQIVRERREDQSPGIDIMLAIDVSSSMADTDLKPNRLVAARQVAEQFVNNRKNDRIGLVAFAGEAFSLCPLTTDYALVRQYLGEMNQGLIPASGTAIGDALARCINRMRTPETAQLATDSSGSSVASQVIILLSDGENTAGNLEPVMAARLAKAYGIRIYTIAVGKVVAPAALPADSTQTQFVVDEGVLKTIAEIGSGSFFRASDGKQLGQIFAQIDKLEKAPVQTRVYQDVQDFYRVYLYWALSFFLLALFLKSTIFGNILED
jgi:Ca-activated chloride channel homolog